MVAPYHPRAPLCRDWMDRASSSDCRLLYEIIGPRGRARAIQAPTPATDSGSNRERETEKREARADIAAAARSHAHHTERVSTHILSGSSPADTVVLTRGWEKRGKAGDGRIGSPFRRWRTVTRCSARGDPRPSPTSIALGSAAILIDRRLHKASLPSNWKVQFSLRPFNSPCAPR